MANTPVLSPEAWEAVKAASIRGVSDSQLAESFGVTEETIRTKRFRDEVWKLAVSANRELVNGNIKRIETGIETKEPEGLTNAQKGALTAQEAIASGKVANELLLLQIASKGLKQADGKMPEVKSWGDVKAIADIVSKIGPQAQTAVQVNVLTDGQAQFSAFEFPSFESEPLDIENVE